MTGDPLTSCDLFIVTLLSADSTLQSLLGGPDRIFADAADPDEIAPYVIFSYQSGIDRKGSGTVRIVTRPLYLVKAVTQDDSYTTASAIAARCDFLIELSHGIADGLNISCEGRQSPVRLYEMLNGNRWNYVGGLYRFFIS